MDTASLLSDLTPAQRRAVETDASPLCILAGAGSGKTRVLTRRIAYRLATATADPGHVLALTFTRRAAGELGDRLRSLGVRQRLTAGTFHAVAYAQLRRYWADRGEPPPQLLDRKTRLLVRLVAGRPDVARAPLPELAAEIEWASARLISPERYPAEADAARRRPPVPAEAMASLLARYQSEKVRRRLADFDDLLARCAHALQHDPAFAAVQRWRWRHVFVDEFQDVNPLQYRLLSAWLGGQHDVCVVGDPNQAVYGWNGADPTLLTRLSQLWPTTEVIHLDHNHRCTPQVVAAAAYVLGSSGARLRSSRADGPPAAVRAYPDDAAEAHGVVAELRQRHAAGVPWTQMAILVRTNAQVRGFEVACRAAQLPYRLAGARPLLDDPEIQALLADVGRRRTQPFELVAADLAQLARAPEEGAQGDVAIGDADVGGGTGAGGSGTAGGTGGGAGPEAAARTLSGLASDFRRMENRPTVDDFLNWLGPATSRDRVDEGPPGVTISTFHRAKGLEWQAVWVTGLEEGLVPIVHAQTGEADNEERRLLYVALTRAGEELHMSWARERTFGDRPIPRHPSAWLAGIAGPGTGGERPAITPDGEWRERLTAQRDRLAECRRPASGLRRGQMAAADPAVIAALRAWRAGAARAAGVPAHVVLHDATLAAVAAVRPATSEELLGVPGLGAVRVARYGSVLLDLVASHQASA
ncbi:MAG: ATP-dependent DNA helicase UvrD2 [Actinomycetota bacterium]|nr:ATP-dependent DNA helicase UvrD2 [Actinomycetota bacterium]